LGDYGVLGGLLREGRLSVDSEVVLLHLFLGWFLAFFDFKLSLKLNRKI
jgi:hypothetical protein